MTAKNTALATAFTAISNSSARDKVLYKETTGLVDTAKAVKLYIKSIFGARSAEYTQVSVIDQEGEEIKQLLFILELPLLY